MTIETVTLSLRWEETPGHDFSMRLGPQLVGQVTWLQNKDGSKEWRVLYSPWLDSRAFPTREAAQAALVAAVKGVGVASDEAADAARFQKRVDAWIQHCFGSEIGADKIERNHRFIEEALELVQAGGCTASEAHQLVDYVYGRPVGELDQEVGGVMNTLAAFCNAHGVDLDAAAERELVRVWGKSEQIRAKQAAKPKHSPLPEHIDADRAARAQEVGDAG